MVEGSPSGACVRSSHAKKGRSPPYTSPASSTAPTVILSRPAWLPCAPVRATTKASTIHATTSTTAAALSESWPKPVPVSPLSFRMRAITGKAVMDRAAPMNSAKGQKPTPWGAKAGYSTGASATPRPSGTTVLTRPTMPAAWICWRTPRCARSSSPITNMNSTRPTVDSADSPPSEALAKSWPCTSGSRAPMMTGPSTMPAAISPTTLGCPRCRSSQPQTRAVPRMTMSWSSRVVVDMVRTG